MVIFENAAKSAFCGTQGRVEGVDIGFLQVGSLLNAKANLESSGLIVEAVGARNQLLVFLLEWEPRLQVVFLSSGIVQCTRNNRHNVIGELKRLVKLLGIRHHVVKGLPRVFGLGQNELLDLHDRC